MLDVVLLGFPHSVILKNKTSIITQERIGAEVNSFLMFIKLVSRLGFVDKNND